MKPYRRCGTRPGTHVRVGRQHPARAPSGQYAIASDTRVCVPAAPRGLPTGCTGVAAEAPHSHRLPAAICACAPPAADLRRLKFILYNRC